MKLAINICHVHQYTNRLLIHKLLCTKKKQLLDDDLLNQIFNSIRNEYQIDKNQESFFSHLIKMVGGKDDKPYITIDGFSGTGKTYILTIAIKYLHRVFQDSFFKSLLNKYKILVITKDPSSIKITREVQSVVLFHDNRFDR